MDGESPVTIDNCEREPIHIPGAIQPHGLLFACRGPQLVVEQVSANSALHIGVEPQRVLGRSLAELLDPECASTILIAGETVHKMSVAPLRVIVRSGAAFDASLHLSDTDLVLVELERAASEPASTLGSFDPRLRTSLRRMQSTRDIAELCSVAAHEVRELTGFDRVMVYRFDADWNGEVVAESRREDLEPFLGLHYPASDIPAQARRLYTINWLRLIADIDYQPVPLTPQLNPHTKQPLDLSFSVLRSVSPIHVEYLKNMGVTASMSISLLIDGRLTGLIACHHYTGPKIIPTSVRDTAEYLGQSLSWQLQLMESSLLAQRRLLTQQHEADLMRNVTVSEDLLRGLDNPSLLSLTEASGAAIVLMEGTRCVGTTPAAEHLPAIVAWLVEQGHDVFDTDCLGQHFPAAQAWEHVAAGILAVAISREVGEYILWFRPAAERTVRWAGDPRKVVDASGPAPRLSPRGSFALWLETVKGRGAPWTPWQVEAASSVRRLILGGVRKRAVELRSLNERLIQADRAKDEFIATVSHELRTPLNSITGWTSLLQSGQLSAERTTAALDVISRNAKLQTRLVEDLLDIARIASGKLTLEMEPLNFAQLVEGCVDAATISATEKGVQLRSELDKAAPVMADSARLRQVVMNLLGNAIKFTPKGGSISVRLDAHDGVAQLAVIDTGQGLEADFSKHMFEPFRQQDAKMNRRSQGLGLGLSIAKRITELHGGTISAESPGVGLGSSFYVRIPMARVVREPTAVLDDSTLDSALELQGKHILVVEDDDDARSYLVNMLRNARATVSEAPDGYSALELLDHSSFDLIISDVGMPGMDGLELMRTVRKRSPDPRGRLPAIALTAYARSTDRTAALRAGFNAHVPKPIDINELVAVIMSLLGELGVKP